MGCVSSRNDPARLRSKQIDKQLLADAETVRVTIRLLLLGAGDSGKSTILKQMRIIHDAGYSPVDLKGFRPIIYNNVIQSFTTIIRAMEKLEISFSEPDRERDARMLLSFDKTEEEDELPEKIVSAMKRIWSDDGAHQAVERSREYHLNDSAPYYLNQLDRICDDDYIPTKDDILRARTKTSGIVEFGFEYKERLFTVVDVGGQRSERKKWINCFDKVTAIIFCVAMSEYDLVLREDNQTNRMKESLKLFDSICNNKSFVDKPIILFLNKTDLFEEKIGRSPLTHAFPEYTGENESEEAREYIKQKFEEESRRVSVPKEIYSHFTCATDTTNVAYVFDAVTDIIIQGNLRHCGLN